MAGTCRHGGRDEHGEGVQDGADVVAGGVEEQLVAVGKDDVDALVVRPAAHEKLRPRVRHPKWLGLNDPARPVLAGEVLLGQGSGCVLNLASIDGYIGGTTSVGTVIGPDSFPR